MKTEIKENYPEIDCVDPKHFYCKCEFCGLTPCVGGFKDIRKGEVCFSNPLRYESKPKLQMRMGQFEPLDIEKSLVDITSYSQDEVTMNYEED